MLATALHPIVIRVSTKVPLVVAALLAMLALLLPFVLIGASIIPAFIVQLPNLVKTFNNLLNNSTFLPTSLRNINLNQYIQSGGNYLLQSTGVITNIATSIFIVFFLTFYLIVDWERLTHIFLSIFPGNKRTKIKHLLLTLAEINGQYIRGNLLISLICGIIMFTGFVFLGLPYAMPLAIFTAIMDLLPLVGSTIGAIPAVIIGFSISPLTGFLVLILMFVYQQIEGAILSPTIYNKALKLSPALGFLAVLIGSSLFGIMGAFLALPFAASLPAIIAYIHDESQS
jgi:predicted PurR-regulated permease PerM